MKIIMVFVAVAFVVGTVLLSMDPGGGGGGMPSNSIAVVNGREIPYEVYNGRVSQLAEMERQRRPRGELSSSDYERIEREAWDGILEEIVTSQEAQRLGLVASDDEIIATLENNPPDYLRQAFTDENGEFNVAAYQQALNDPSFDWHTHENYLRAVLPAYKLRQMVRAKTIVSELDVRREFGRRNQSNKVEFIGLEWNDVEVEEPTEEEVRAFYDANLDLYRHGQTATLEALRLPKEPSDADRAELLVDAQSMLDEVETGRTKDFATLAEIYTEGRGADQGGALGWVKKSALPEELQDVVEKLTPGQYSKPIDTEQAVYMVQVDSSRTDSDGEDAYYVRQIFLRHEASNETLDSLRTLAFEIQAAAEKNFTETASTYGLEIERLENVDASGFVQGFGFSLGLRDWAFEAEANEVGGPFGNDRGILITRLVSINEAEPRAFEDVKDRARSAALEERKKARASQKVQAVLDRVKSGESLASAASAEGLEVRSPAPFTYYESVPDVGGANAFTAVASELRLGELSGVVETPTGAYAIRLLWRDVFDEAAYSEQRQQHYQNLVSQRASQAYQAYLEELKAKADIVDRRTPRV